MLLVAKRDYLAAVRTKAFLFGLIVAPLLFGGSFVGMAIFRVESDTKPRHIAILDRTGAVAPAIIRAAEEKNARELMDKATGKQVAPRYCFEAVQPQGEPTAQRLALSGRVSRKELFAFLEIGPQALHPTGDKEAKRIAYFSNAGGLDEVRGWLGEPVNRGLREARLAELGVDSRHFGDVLGSASLERMSLVTRDAKTGGIAEARKKSDLEGFIVPFSIVMLLGMIVMVGASPMLAAVTEDKTQRVIEMLLGAAAPFDLMAGKVLGAIALSLTSSAFYVASATSALYAFGMTGMVPFEVLPWFYIYLIADVTLLSAFASALGAACSTTQEAQSLNVLLLAPVLIPFFMLVPMLRQPNGALATALSLFPPFTPLLMLLRQSMPGGVPWWQPWVGLAGVLTCTVAAVWAASRIFRIGILMQGKMPRPAQLVQWVMHG